MAVNTHPFIDKIQKGFDMQNANEISSQTDSAPQTICPYCQSTRLKKHNYGKKAGGTIGTVAGAAAGAAGAMSGAEIGTTVGVVFGPAGAVLGGIAGAIFGGLIGGSTGCIAGAKIGETFDEHLFSNYLCLSCNHEFSIPSKSSALIALPQN